MMASKKAAMRGRARRSPRDMLVELKAALREIADLRAAGAVLSWDQATYMPEGRAAARGRRWRCCRSSRTSVRLRRTWAA